MLEKIWKPAVAQAHFASHDLDEVREFMDGHNGAHWRHARRPGPVGFRLAVMEGEEIRLAWCGMWAQQTIRGAVGSLTAHVTLEGRSEYRVGRQDVVAGAGDVVFLPPQREMTIEAEGLRRLVLQVPAGLRGGDRLSGVTRHSLPIAALASLQGAVEALARVDGLPPAGRAAARGQAESRLADWMLDRLPDPSEERRMPRLAPERVRRIEEWIDAHLHEPVSLARLCEQAGVGARCLQLAFESHRRQSPMAFVAERRLVAAHAALSRGQYGSVTAVASAFGFEHPGRFATRFRRLYGLTPSEMRPRSHADG